MPRLALAALALAAAGCAAADSWQEPAAPAEPAVPAAPATPAAPTVPAAPATPAIPLAAAPAEPAAADAKASAEGLERLKALKGRWKGDFLHGEEKGVAEVEYRLTGGGTAVQETLFPGEPHEMVTLYHLDGSRLLLTHYCAAGNQPTMVLAPGGAPGVLHFDFLRATNLKTPGDGHMHEASFDLSDPARLRTTWTFWADGKAQGTAAMDLRRVE